MSHRTNTQLFSFQNIDVVCMPSPGDFEFHDPSGGIDRDHKCYVTGWGRRTESKPIC